MLKTLLTATLLGAAAIAGAQATPTATRFAEGQVGGSYINGQSDYARSRFNGYGFYADLDFRGGLGAEAEYHYMSDTDPNVGSYERTYEIGGRYSRHYGRWQPYGKVMVGRGVFNYPQSIYNLAYNMVAYGGGADVRLTHIINMRLEYESQHWFGFEPNGLTPNMLTLGVAYHFK